MLQTDQKSIEKPKNNEINHQGLAESRMVFDITKIEVERLLKLPFLEQKKLSMSQKVSIIVAKAIKEDKVKAFFQGIRNNKAGKIMHYEALMRIFKDNGEMLPPNFFLSHIKDTYLMIDVSKIVIKQTVEKMLHSDPDFTFSVNLGNKELSDSSLIDFIIDEMANNNINPERLLIEILEDSSDVNDLSGLNKLRSFGLHTAIDDFGEGYSNFKRLLEMKDANALKIDKGLIKGIIEDSSKGKEYELDRKTKIIIIKSLVDIANLRKMKIFAEGVENEETQKIIEDLGIHYTQGYLYSKPSADIGK